MAFLRRQPPAFEFPRRATERLEDALAVEGFPAATETGQELRALACEVHRGKDELLAAKVARRRSRDVQSV